MTRVTKAAKLMEEVEKAAEPGAARVSLTQGPTASSAAWGQCTKAEALSAVARERCSSRHSIGYTEMVVVVLVVVVVVVHALRHVVRVSRNRSGAVRVGGGDIGRNTGSLVQGAVEGSLGGDEGTEDKEDREGGGTSHCCCKVQK